MSLNQRGPGEAQGTSLNVYRDGHFVSGFVSSRVLIVATHRGHLMQPRVAEVNPCEAQSHSRDGATISFLALSLLACINQDPTCHPPLQIVVPIPQYKATGGLLPKKHNDQQLLASGD